MIEEPKANAAGPFIPAKGITIQVRDENGRPVQDAAVAFRFPDTSASGTFADGTQSAVAYTDASGTAHVEGIRWIASSGSVPVRITASKGNSHAGLLFEEKLSESVVPTAAPIVRAEEGPVKPALPSFTPAVPVPGADQPKASAVSAAGELAAVTPAARPSVSIATYSKSSSASANSFRSNAEPSVSISSSPQTYSSHSSLKKWLIWSAIAAGAGAGAAFAFSGKGSVSSTTSSSSTTVGTPTINVGH